MTPEEPIRMERTTVTIEGDRNLYRYEFTGGGESDASAGTLERIDMGASETE